MKNKPNLVLGLLIALSSFAYFLDYFNAIDNLFVGLLLITTMIKGMLIIEHFMGLRSVTLKYRLIPHVWLVTTLLLITSIYYR